jgi:excisionase family DNA binding protein
MGEVPEVMTVNEAAEYLRVHHSTIRRHIEAGKIPAFRVGGAWRLHKKSIDQWQKEQEMSRLVSHEGTGTK